MSKERLAIAPWTPNPKVREPLNEAGTMRGPREEHLSCVADRRTGKCAH